MKESVNDASYFVPVIDARRGYVYAAIYNKNDREILNSGYIKLSVLKDKLKMLEDYLIITNDDIEVDGIKTKYKPDILVL